MGMEIVGEYLASLIGICTILLGEEKQCDTQIDSFASIAHDAVQDTTQVLSSNLSGFFFKLLLLLLECKHKLFV